MEKAYDDISIPDCAKMLNLDPTRLEAYIRSRGWNVKNGRIRFESVEESDKKSDDDLVPTKELAQMVLSYAKEMEKIVWTIFEPFSNCYRNIFELLSSNCRTDLVLFWFFVTL